MEKTNIERLKDSVNESTKLISALEKEIKTKNSIIKELEEADDDDDEKEVEYDNSDFVGLDTIRWSLDNGNLVIQQRMESFIHSLKKENLVTA